MTIKQLVSHARTLALLAAPLAGTACNSETPTGTLIVPFEIGADVECSVANVTEVKITLFDQPIDGEASAEFDSLTVPCSEGQAIFNNLPVDRYYVMAEGKDAENITVVDNGGKAEAEADEGEVLAGKETTANTVGMSPTPAQLWVRFSLNEDDGQVMCPSVPIANFNVTASKSMGLSPLISTSIACDAVPDPDDNFHHIVDESRVLDGAAFDHIRVEALDMTGNSTGTDIKYQLVAPPGPGRIVKINFTADCSSADGTCNLVCNGGTCTPV